MSFARPVNRWQIRGRSNSNTFGMVRHYANGSPKPHQGWDFAAATGDPCFAVADGTVAFTAVQGDYGGQICLQFQKGAQTLYAFYAHLQFLYAYQGMRVERGLPIGTVGKSGNAWNQPESERHLHFEVRTIARPGLGLGGRLSPMVLFGPPPL
jgi:murein DD-endopeptidase MepM/ murein hydrolase activator NlpD